MFGGVYDGRRVLVTGDSGFKGAWLVSWLRELGARVSTVSLPPPTDPSLFGMLRLWEGVARREADIGKPEVLRAAVAEEEPEIIFHLAAQSLVRASYEDPEGTMATNVMGTVHLLEAVRRARRPCAVVVCTSDKCYENREWVHGYRETDALGGRDPYSASKGAAEIVTASYRSSFFPPDRFAEHRVGVASVRAGNVIGPGDWAKDRIIVDCVRSLAAGRPISIRNPDATRPWQHVLEPLAGYLTVGAALFGERGGEIAEAWNFGPGPEASRPVRRLVEHFVSAWGDGAWVEAVSVSAPHEAMQLRLSIDKAVTRLGWRPLWGFEGTVRRTAMGYRSLLGADTDKAREIVHREIEDYVADAEVLGVPWAVE